ncbi:hypothetical protein [Oceanobacillus polygoni]|uniref:D-serine deaminase-like pyridoxal phosphate-dependent protein n=1 Tax=Oceanobacillus polygoni TaxID=1235259 RepID=A0A9X1CA18_9BACI|nr:hypothetical protein [Oceanobacillus polygoni]MBP2076029.1 D-serine deaminase-like pyridoxal phosphate-dependent protein [Oceanobacillus polygoni]
MKNIKDMQAYADKQNIKLRPYTKTHKMPKLALLHEKAHLIQDGKVMDEVTVECRGKLQ